MFFLLIFLMEDELAKLEEIFNDKKNELDGLKKTLNKKAQEVKIYYDICGEDPSFDKLKEVLSYKLSLIEKNIGNTRNRLNVLRLKKKGMENSGNLLVEINDSIEKDNKDIEEIKNKIEEKTKKCEELKEKLRSKMEGFKDKQAEVDELKKKVVESNKRKEGISKQLQDLLNEEAKLKEQHGNLKGEIVSTKKAIEEIKRSMNMSEIQKLEKEIEELQNKVGEPLVEFIEDENINDIDDLDPLYRNQIEKIKSKIEGLKSQINEMQDQMEKKEMEYQVKISEQKIKLNRLKENNDIVRSNIEEMELSLPKTLAPINREIEQWRIKIDKALAESQKDEELLYVQKSQSEAALLLTEKHHKSLQDEIIKIQSMIDGLKSSNEKKVLEIEKMKEKYDNILSNKRTSEESIMQIEKEITEIEGKIAKNLEECERYNLLIKQENEQSDEEFKTLKEKIDAAEHQMLSVPKNRDSHSGHVNDDELRQSISNLEQSISSKKEALDELRKSYAESEQIRKNFDSALVIISELEDEEVSLIQEVQMIKKTFEESIASLKSQKNSK